MSDTSVVLTDSERDKKNLLDELHREGAHLEALPPVDIEEVIGLCEVVQEHGGRADLSDLVREFGYLRLMLPATQGARTLGFVKIRDGQVMLTPLGRAWVTGDPRERQRVLGDQVASLKLTRWLCTLAHASGDGAVSEDVLLAQMSALLSAREAGSTFWTLVNWGSYARIFHYDGDQKRLVLGPGSLSS
jgi:NitT/TauT family transport system ATP-binding protein